MVERLTNDIDVFTVGGDGTWSPIVVNPSAGPDALSVSFSLPTEWPWSPKPVPLAPNGSAISSYAVAANGTLSHDRNRVPTLGAAKLLERRAP